ncbi:hypothetical protein BDZ97DRAFT_1934971 [Flammula alnicola]|nr:hypothetical protein BDZ97DRAFT_1934971 [Flammula alnicola]
MPSPLYASLQPAWTFLSQKLIWFALTPETRHVSAASRVLAQANYMPELEATGTREPRACTYIRRWMWFLAHAANEPIPEFARIDIFNVTQEANFYPLHADWVSGAGLKLAPPYPQFVGVAQRLLDAEWVSSPAVEAAQDHLAAIPEMDLGAPRLSPPPSPAVQPATKAAEVSPGGMDLGGDEASLPLPLPLALSAREDSGDRLRSLLDPPPRPSKTRKGKARARTPPSPPRAPTTRAAAARLAAASRLAVVPRPVETLDVDPSVLADRAAAVQLAEARRQQALPGVASSSQITLDVEPTIPQSLKRKVAALGDARSNGPMTLPPPVCTACRLKGLEPEECVVPPGEHGCERCKRNRHGICSFRAKLKDQVPEFEASVEVSQLSLTNLHSLFGRLHRTSAWNLVQREYVRQSELEMSALSREISGILHRLVAMDPDDSFRDLYVEDNDAMAALVDVLSASAPGSLPTTDPHPNSRTTLSELASLLEGVPAPSWFPRPDHRYLPRAVPPQENVSEAGDVAGSVDTDTALAELDELDEQIAILDSLTSAKHWTLELPMASNNQVDASNTPPAYNQNLRDIWMVAPILLREQVAIKEARFTALFNAAHNLDTLKFALR